MKEGKAQLKMKLKLQKLWKTLIKIKLKCKVTNHINCNGYKLDNNHYFLIDDTRVSQNYNW